MLPTFKTLTSKYKAAEVRARIDAVVELLKKEIPDGQLNIGQGDLNGRYLAMLADIKKRADHTGFHGFKHDLKLHSGDVAEEVMLFFVEQVTLLAEFAPDVKDKLSTVFGGDPSAPDKESEMLRLENAGAHSAIGKSGALVRAVAEKMLSDKPPDPPAGQPSAADLMFFSALTYENLDKALWHTTQARRARRLIAAYKASSTEKDANGVGKIPVHTCQEAATAAYLLQTYFHHFHKAKVYASPMIALTEFCTHYVTEWQTAWAGNSTAEVPAQPPIAGKPAVPRKDAVEDPAALRNLREVYETIITVRANHKKFDCVTKGGICYGPKDDPKKQNEPLKEMGYTDGSNKLTPATPAVKDQPWYDDVADWAGKQKLAMSKGWAKAGQAVESFFDATKMKVGTFYEDSLVPLYNDIFDDASILESNEPAKGESFRDNDSIDSILLDTKLQFERFSFWVMSDVKKTEAKQKKIAELMANPAFLKRKLRRMTAGAHDDVKHAVEPPWTKLFSTSRSENTVEIDDARVARMMYDIYGLVESKDFGTNVASKFKKFWVTQKKGEMAVTLVFVGAGIAISILGGGLPVIALVGIAAAKKVMKKAALKKVKRINLGNNQADIKAGKVSPDVELTYSAQEAREGAASLARHFVSSYKNMQRMLDIRKKFAPRKDEKFVFDTCSAAAGYAYAVHAFEHHFDKTLARLHHVTAMSAAVLSTLEEGEEFFDGAEFIALRKEIHDVVAKDLTWHLANCDGPQVLKASRAAPTNVSLKLKSCVCYSISPRAPLSVGNDEVTDHAVRRGLFHMDYTMPGKELPPTEMLDQWQGARDVLLETLAPKLAAEVQREKNQQQANMRNAPYLAILARNVKGNARG